MAAFSERRYEVNGVDTAVFSAGDGPPLVFFHGGGTMTGFDALLPLAERARLIVPHHPGFGASADDESIESRQDYHFHYLELFDQLGLGELALVGHSLGGAMAAAFAALHPERVRRLVLAAPWGLLVPEHPTVALSSLPGDEIAAYLFADLSRFEGLPAPPPEFIAEREREAISLARVVPELPYDPKLARWLRRIAAPTLVLWGDADRLIPVGQAAVWAEHIPAAEIQTFPGAGHLLFDESASAVEAAGAFAARP
jgi:pimeloyl-ACP methyl ester carboxylesterase